MPTAIRLGKAGTSNTAVKQSEQLCLACSSSLLPWRTNNASASSSSSHFSDGIFFTSCCERPICQRCISSNPRLARYNPCLACLSGVAAISHSGSPGSRLGLMDAKQNILNVDGAVRDEDTFVVGDDEDEDESRDDIVSSPSPPLLTASEDRIVPPSDSSVERKAKDAPLKYYIRASDTLQGIAFKFKVNGHELCRINKLPSSTLKTTPHLLHTRTYILLPPSAASASPSSLLSPEDERERKMVRQHEIAGKRLQLLTKEMDWHVAKAYIDIADIPEDEEEMAFKQKESGFASAAGPSSTLESRAVARYLDDEEWESQQRKHGRPVGAMGFPFFHSKESVLSGVDVKKGSRSWWKWKD